MADHRIRLTDRELELARSAAWSASWAMLPIEPVRGAEYRQLAERLEFTKAGGMPLAARDARKKALIRDGA